MARKQNDDLLIEDELAAAFLNDDDLTTTQTTAVAVTTDDAWDDSEEEFPGQLAVDVYETDEKLVVKARTAGVNKEELDVSISDGILTISGTLSSGDETDATIPTLYGNCQVQVRVVIPRHSRHISDWLSATSLETIKLAVYDFDEKLFQPSPMTEIRNFHNGTNHD